jgi:hypothetical protein
MSDRDVLCKDSELIAEAILFYIEDVHHQLLTGDISITDVAMIIDNIACPKVKGRMLSKGDIDLLIKLLTASTSKNGEPATNLIERYTNRMAEVTADGLME